MTDVQAPDWQAARHFVVVDWSDQRRCLCGLPASHPRHDLPHGVREMEQP